MNCEWLCAKLFLAPFYPFNGMFPELKIPRLVESIIQYLIKNGEATISDFRKLTMFKYTSREITVTLRKLQRDGLVNYRNRVWFIPR